MGRRFRFYTQSHGLKLAVMSAIFTMLSANTWPGVEARKDTFLALQEWEGRVVCIEQGAFVAHLKDLSAEKSHESEEATIPIDELSDRDAADLTVGGIFRWVIGYERSPEGTRKRVSQIIFRDFPRMTEGDFQSGGEWANRIAPVLDR